MEIKEINRRFFDLWARFYDYSFFVKPWLLYIQKKTVVEIKLKDNIKILDVGCGTGDSLIYLYNKNQKLKLFGIDISKNMLKIARKKLGNKAILKFSDVEKIQFENNFFDYVINTEAFHHFPNPNKAIKEMSRVLKKKGKLIITDINFYSNFIHWLFKKIEPGHVKIYNEKEFQKAFEKNKLKVIKQKRIGLFAILTLGEK
ncbi:methyltransferase domain-containing protein [Candidatus Woesearchaeota archaeon]|nr:methyltransferase domain-containing protein [Candidatus Woesearchaeota archaeon]